MTRVNTLQYLETLLEKDFKGSLENYLQNNNIISPLNGQNTIRFVGHVAKKGEKPVACEVAKDSSCSQPLDAPPPLYDNKHT